MNTQQLQQEIQKTQEQLQRLQEQLEASKTITIETAQPGDTLPDGTVVIERYSDSVLIAAPSTTEVYCEWTPEFQPAFDSLKKRGFIPSQWHVPSLKELQLAYKNCKEQFANGFYWSSTEFGSKFDSACYVNLNTGKTDYYFKPSPFCVRAFRRVYLDT